MLISRDRFSWLIFMMLLMQGLAAQAADIPAQLQSVLDRILVGREYQVSPAPLDNIYEVVVGPSVYYFSGDGRHMLQGALVDLVSGENITEARLSVARKSALDSLDKTDFIEFSAKENKHLVTVFTDIDCGYCRKLHGEMAEYNSLGISVRYLAFPRAGIGSESYDKAVSVWCSANPKEAMDKAKAGAQVAKATCDNPVAEEFKLGEKMGVRGTPNIIFEDGTLLPGYYPPDSLIKALEGKS